MKQTQLRQARKQDAKQTAPLILDAFDTEVQLLGKNHRERIKTLKKLFKKPKNRVSYKNTTIATNDREITGVLINFSGDKLQKKNRYTFLHLILTKNPIKLIRTLIIYIKQISHMTSLEEAKKDEYYIACLSVHPKHRRKGIAKILLQEHEKQAREKNLNKTSLCVHGENKPEINLYLKQGYTIKDRALMDGIKLMRMTKKLK